MRIAWVIHLYPPTHMCGSEMVAHQLNKFLISKGHEVRVILMQADMHNIKVPYEYEGVKVFGPPSSSDGYAWGQVLMTHLDYTRHTIAMAQMINRPVVNFIHNSHPYAEIVNARGNNYCVYNSKWIADKLGYRWPSIVFNPPCDYRVYDLKKNPRENEYITLINLDENKGGKILAKIAAAMPSKKFLAVKGGYSEPAVIGQWTKQPSNVTVIENTTDIASVYSRTRILLMLSRYESWGRTATEAMCNGIPVICTPTPGLMENCADAGIYVKERGEIKRNGPDVVYEDSEDYDISYIMKAITKLDKDKKYYEAVSALCRERSRELDPQHSFAKAEDFIINAYRTADYNQARRMAFV